MQPPLVVKAVRKHLKLEEPNDDGGIVKTHVVRVEIQADQLVVQLTSTKRSKRGGAGMCLSLRLAASSE
jgi:hypothetical protein